jgi:hypothetical protein
MVAPMKMPRPPEDVLRRVIRISRLNGWSVAIFAGLGILVSLAVLDPIGIAVCLLIALGGAIEVRGCRRLRRRDPDGMRLLVRSQLVVLGVIWVYALPRLLSFDATYLQDEAIPNLRELLSASGMDFDSILAQAGLTTKDIVPLVHLFFVVLYGSVMLVTLFYQGGLALYYRHRTAAVTEALKAPPPALTGSAAGAPADATPFSGADQHYYDVVAEELARKDVKPGLWARALAESGADDARAQAFYIRLRVAELQREESARQS